MARKSSSPKRKRASLPIDASQPQLDENDAGLEENPRPKKRGRPRKSLDGENGAKSQQPKKRVGRPSLGDKAPVTAAGRKNKKQPGRPAAATTADENGDDLPRLTRGPNKRPRDSVQEGRQLEAEEQPQSRKPRRGRPSLEEAAPSDSTRQPHKTKRSRRRTIEEATEGTPETARTSRRTSSGVELLIADAPSKPRTLPHVTPRTRGVKQSVVDAKWGPLDPASQNAATETLVLAHRPIMQRMSNSQQRRQFSATALGQVHRRISRQLQRGFPFPPSGVAHATGRGRRKAGHEAELDFESVLDGTAALERQLDPALHAVELLKREKKKMEEELEMDYATLRNLEAGARGETRLRKERLRKMHVLAPEKREERDHDDLVFDKGGGVPPGMVFRDLEEGELKELALQLSGHVDSIRSNLQQAEGLVPQLQSSSASLRSVLSRHLDAGQYNRVVFG